MTDGLDTDGISIGELPAQIALDGRRLTAVEFQGLAVVPPEFEWFENLKNPGTKRIYKNAIWDFMRFTGITRPEEFRLVTRAHVIAWRDDLERRHIGANKRQPAGCTIRNRLAALSSLFEYLCDRNAVPNNPVKGVKRPKTQSGAGATPTIGDNQARQLLAAPTKENLKAKRDRAILSTLLYHALRREELCKLKVSDFKHAQRGVPHLKIAGKGEKTRYVPIHPATNALIHDYLEAAGHGGDEAGALFRPVKNNITKTLARAITPNAVYKLVMAYALELGFKVRPHALRATAATNALDNDADIAKVKEWLGHASISTTQLYDHRKTRPEDSPTFKVSY
jgi:integrase/recombinase XerD